MILNTSFKFIIGANGFNELQGIVANQHNGDRLALTEILPPDALVSTNETIGFINFNVLYHESVIDLIKMSFRAETVYWFKANSLNFNMSELPFQTYSPFLTLRDANHIRERQYKDWINAQFSEHLEHFYSNTKGIGTKNEIIIYRALDAIVKRNLNFGDLYTNLKNAKNLSLEDQSRFWNQILLISVIVYHDPNKYGLLKAWLEALDAKDKLENIKRL